MVFLIIPNNSTQRSQDSFFELPSVNNETADISNWIAEYPILFYKEIDPLTKRVIFNEKNSIRFGRINDEGGWGLTYFVNLVLRDDKYLKELVKKDYNKNVITYGSYEVSNLTSGDLNYEVLKKYDVFVNIRNTEFSESEKDAIYKYVEKGGGFLMIVDINANVEEANTLLNEFCIEVGDNASYDLIRVFYDHPISENVERVKLHSAIELHSCSNNSKCIGEVLGGACVVAISEYGKGRVVVIGDWNIFSNEHFMDVEEEGSERYGYRNIYPTLKDTDFLQFAHNIFHWLSDPGAPIKSEKPELSAEWDIPLYLEYRERAVASITVCNKGGTGFLESWGRLGPQNLGHGKYEFIGGQCYTFGFTLDNAPIITDAYINENGYVEYWVKFTLITEGGVDTFEEVKLIPIYGYAEVLLERAELAFKNFRFPEALSGATQAKQIFEELQDKENVYLADNIIQKYQTAIDAQKLFDEGIEFNKRSEYGAARQKFLEAKQKFQEIGISQKISEVEMKEADALFNQAKEAFEEQNYEIALDFFEQARDLYSSLGSEKAIECNEWIQKTQTELEKGFCLGTLLIAMMIGFISLIKEKNETR